MNHNNNENQNDDDDNIITITLIDMETGHSEVLTISQRTTTIQDIIEYTEALFSLLSYDPITKTHIQFLKDGKVLFTSLLLLMNVDPTTTKTMKTRTTTTLQQLGIIDGDLILCIKKKMKSSSTVSSTAGTTTGTSSSRAKSSTTGTTDTNTNTNTNTNTTTSSSTSTMELDFTNLLQQHQHNDTTTTTTNTKTNTSTTMTTPSSSSTNIDINSTTNTNIDVIYTNEMNLQEIQYYNTHPKQIIFLLYTKEHLMKELNYYSPKLAKQLQSIFKDKNTNHNYMEDAIKVYRDYMVQQSIENAYKNTNQYHIQQNMELRYKNNPNDIEAHEYILKQQQLKVIQEQYEYVMNEYPESLINNILMLYIPMKINGYTINAFCDSGAQQTIMSKSCAIACQLDQYIDTRMAGIAVGVGTGIILGRIHIVQIQIMEQYFFPCSITVIDDTDTSSNNNNTDDNNMDMDDQEKSISSKSQPPKRKEMPFLFGLDMMKRHLCCIDLQKHCLRFTSILVQKTKTNNTNTNNNTTSIDTTTTTNDTTTNTNQQQQSQVEEEEEEEEYVPLEVPFLHEKDLLPSQGGTKKE